MPDRTRFAREVSKYLEYRPLHLETGGGLPDEPMGKKHKGSTRPPVNARGFRWIDEAVTFTKLENGEQVSCNPYETRKHHALLNAIVESYRLGSEKVGGIALSDVVAYLWEDSSAVTWMIDGRSETAKAYHDAFRALCRRIAGDFLQIESEVELSVDIPTTEASVRNLREAAYTDRKDKTRRDYLIIFKTWQGIKDNRGVGSEEAKRIMEQERAIKKRTVERAITMFGNGDAA